MFAAQKKLMINQKTKPFYLNQNNVFIMQKKKIKTILKKAWYFIWEDDSVWSWIVNVILAYALIKFIVYPFLGLILGTSYPIVAVVSSSMEHDGSFNEWWNSAAYCANGNCLQKEWYSEYSITEKQFKGFSYVNGFNKGDIMVLLGKSPEKIKIGDIIVFKSIANDPIIHRVVKKSKEDSKYYFQTKGDHNPKSISFETKIPEGIIVGKAVFKIPLMGYVKIWFVNLLSLFGLKGA